MPAIHLLNPQEYFRTELTTAATSLNLTLHDEIEFYLVNLLCEFIVPSSIETGIGRIDFDTPLALMLKKAFEVTPDERIKIFKKIGDTSLYFTGYFRSFFNSKTVTIDYYRSMGVNAYTSVSSIMREKHRDDHFTSIYHGLASKFEQLSSLIHFVAENDEKFLNSDERIKYVIGKGNNPEVQ